MARLAVDHVVVDVVRERVGNRQQQPVRRGQRRRQRTGRHQARDHVRQPGDLGRRQHDHVRLDQDFRPLDDAVAIHIPDAEHRRINLAPLHHPLRQFRERRANQMLEELGLDQRRQRGRRHIEQRDAEHGPGHRIARFPDRRRGVQPRQDVRQAGRAEHQAEHQQHEVEPLGLPLRLGRRRVGLGRWRGDMAARQRLLPHLAPLLLGVGHIHGKGQPLPLHALDLAQRRIARAQLLEPLIQHAPFFGE
ncbi:hypothetical protein D3C81_1269060 [compost metagenome]